MSAKLPECVDCRAEGVARWRPITTGVRKPRCATHSRARRKRAQRDAHGRMVVRAYGITSEQYQALYEAQGGVCGICRVARGTVKRLAVDHDHQKARDECDHDPKFGCPNCVRGLLCGPCNQMIGRLPAGALQRAIDYHENPPARQVLFWSPFDDDGNIDADRLQDEGWWFIGATSEDS